MKLKAICIVGLWAVCSWTLAADLVVDGGILQGASGVDVQGTNYSVSLVEGTCVSVFSGCDSSSDFTFTSNAAATAAAQALLDEVFINDPAGVFDDDPTLTAGCTATTDACFGYTPYAVAGGTVSICAAVNHPPDDGHGGDVTACGSVSDSSDTSTNETVWAVWTLEVDIDIKFCSDPNAFNCKKKGVLPVTIFGTDSFDAADIDPSTLQLCLDDLSFCTSGPSDTSIADRGDPTSDLGASMCAIIEEVEQDFLNPDGFDDLDAAFDANEVQTLLGALCSGSKNGVSSDLVIIGSTFGGTPFISAPIGNTGIDQLVKKNR